MNCDQNKRRKKSSRVHYETANTSGDKSFFCTPKVSQSWHPVLIQGIRRPREDSLLPLAQLNIWGLGTASRGSRFLQRERGLIGMRDWTRPWANNRWSIRRSSFLVLAVFLRHQLIKGGLSLNTCKSNLNLTQESWLRHRDECDPLTQWALSWRGISLDNDSQVQRIDSRRLWCMYVG